MKNISISFWIIFIQTYYQVVIASTSAGDKKVVSDGVTIVQEDAELSGVEVFDGLECNGTGIGKNIVVLTITFRSPYMFFRNFKWSVNSQINL